MRSIPNVLVATAAATLMAGCMQTGSEERSFGNDGLPSAEVTAYQATHARLNWANARIEYGTDNCAYYQGTAPDGQVRREQLRNPDNTTICRPR